MGPVQNEHSVFGTFWPSMGDALDFPGERWTCRGIVMAGVTLAMLCLRFWTSDDQTVFHFILRALPFIIASTPLLPFSRSLWWPCSHI